MSEGNELFRKYRPTKLMDVVGQPEAVSILREFSKRNAFPHTMLFTGPNGTGKTSLARIVAKRLGCSEMDYREINAANFRGIDDVREIQRQVGGAPMGGTVRVWYMDECHGLTSDAWDCFLKLLEEPPDHVFFLLATTLPKKLKPTVLSRCTQIPCKPLSVDDLVAVQAAVIEKEALPVGEEVQVKIARAADGSARKALVLLNALVGIVDPSDQLLLIERHDVTPTAFEIAQALMANAPWGKISGLLAKTEEEPETVRRVILAYCKSVLLKSGTMRAHQIIEAFRDPLFDAGSAFPLLVSACFAACSKK